MGYRNGRFFVQHPGESALVICVRFPVSAVCIQISLQRNACEIAVHRAVSV